MRGPRRLEELDRALVVRGGVVRPAADPGHGARPLVQLRLHEGIIGELQRPLERALGLCGRSQGSRSLAGTDEHLASLGADLLGIGIVGRRRVGVEVMGGDDIDDLVLLGAPGRRERNVGGSEVLGLALLLRDRLVGDVLDDVLQERVLAALG